ETRRWARRALREHSDRTWSWRVDTVGIGGFLTAAPASGMLWSALERIVAPVLLIRGETSWALSATDAAAMIERVADGRVVEVAGRGHDLGVQAPDAVVEAIGRFLAGEPTEVSGGHCGTRTHDPLDRGHGASFARAVRHEAPHDRTV